MSRISSPLFIRLRIGGLIRASAILAFAIQGSSRFGDLGCVPDQTHIRSSREATAPQFRLRRAGSRGRDHSSLRRLKPCNPSVRPPGSSEADRASADGLESFCCARAAKPAARRGPGSGGGLHHGPLDDETLGHILPQGHEKLARHRHDRALAALRASLLEPARQGRLRLVRPRALYAPVAPALAVRRSVGRLSRHVHDPDRSRARIAAGRTRLLPPGKAAALRHRLAISEV